MRTVSSKVSKREHAAIVQYANQAGESLSNLIRKVLKGQIKEIKLTLGWGGKPLTINDLTNRTRKESKMIREEESEEKESEEKESEEEEESEYNYMKLTPIIGYQITSGESLISFRVSYPITIKGMNYDKQSI